MTIVGHSLGGGLASLASYATGFRAVTFNAAGIHDNLIVLNASRYGEVLTTDEVRAGLATGDQIRRYVVDGEFLTFLQDRYPNRMPDALGRRITTEAVPVRGFGYLRRVNLHFMEAVFRSLDKYYGMD
nr:lipase family protein [Nocardia arizonensis]